MSWQLFDPWPIVRRLNVPVCYDLRQADLIAGGQGAPITPLADWVMYRDSADMVFNLGGICNFTVPCADPRYVVGRDLCACNLLIDGMVRMLFPGHQCDVDGSLSAAGKVRDDRVIGVQTQIKPTGDDTLKSLGREQFNDTWLKKVVDGSLAGLRPADALTTAIEGVAAEIGDAIAVSGPCLKAVLAGGGAKNPRLVDAIQRRAYAMCVEICCPPCSREDVAISVITTDKLGIPCEAREAMGFAVLGALSQDGVAITLPAVTGAVRPGRAGAWVYP